MSVNTFLQPGVYCQNLKLKESKIVISNSELTISPITPKPLKAIRPQHQKMENPEEIDDEAAPPFSANETMDCHED